MGIRDLFFRKKQSPDRARLVSIREEYDRCLHILNACHSRSEIVAGLEQVSALLKESQVQPPEVRAMGIAGGVLSQLDAISSDPATSRDVYVRKFQQFISQIDAILSE